MLKKLPKHEDANLLVGYELSDDAGVYRINDQQAVVTTADFITPPLADPYIYGQIAAANALSDVYAMGGRPVACLNLVCFPAAQLAPEVLHQIIAGALSKITEAGAVLAGGHSTEDREPKFGLSVTGLVHPDRIWRNSGARPGDRLILTKPLGTGVLFNANLSGWVSDAALQNCIEITTTLNKTAAEVMAGFDIHAATDVTGFGLGGHSFEMARGSAVTLEFDIAALPIMDEALAMYERGMSTGVNAYTHQLIDNFARIDADLPLWHLEILVDPQTSGGLLVSVGEDAAEELLTALHNAGVAHARIVGRVHELQDELYLIFR